MTARLAAVQRELRHAHCRGIGRPRSGSSVQHAVAAPGLLLAQLRICVGMHDVSGVAGAVRGLRSDLLESRKAQGIGGQAVRYRIPLPSGTERLAAPSMPLTKAKLSMWSMRMAAGSSSGSN